MFDLGVPGRPWQLVPKCALTKNSHISCCSSLQYTLVTYACAVGSAQVM